MAVAPCVAFRGKPDCRFAQSGPRTPNAAFAFRRSGRRRRDTHPSDLAGSWLNLDHLVGGLGIQLPRTFRRQQRMSNLYDAPPAVSNGLFLILLSIISDHLGR